MLHLLEVAVLMKVLPSNLSEHQLKPALSGVSGYQDRPGFWIVEIGLGLENETSKKNIKLNNFDLSSLHSES